MPHGWDPLFNAVYKNAASIHLKVREACLLLPPATHCGYDTDMLHNEMQISDMCIPGACAWRSSGTFALRMSLIWLLMHAAHIRVL